MPKYTIVIAADGEVLDHFEVVIAGTPRAEEIQELDDFDGEEIGPDRAGFASRGYDAELASRIRHEILKREKRS
jgi:hypothetical protein